MPQFPKAYRCIAPVTLLMFLNATCFGGFADMLRRATVDPNKPLVDVEVVDETNQPIPGARGTLNIMQQDMAGALQMAWMPSKDGRLQIAKKDLPAYVSPSPDMALQLVVQAPGYAWAIAPVKLGAETTESLKRITLQRGQTVQLKLLPPPGKMLPPDLIPMLTDDEHLCASAARCGTSTGTNTLTEKAGLPTTEPFSLAWVDAITTAPGTYQFQVPANAVPSRMWLIVNHPGFLRGYISDPITSAQLTSGKPLQIQLPAPRTMRVTLAPAAGISDEDFKDKEGMFLFNRSVRMRPDWNSWLQLEQFATKGTPRLDYVLTDLAPAVYQSNLMIFTNRVWGSNEQFSAWADLRNSTSATMSLAVGNQDADAMNRNSDQFTAALANEPVILSRPLTSREPVITLRITGDADQPVSGSQALIRPSGTQGIDFRWRAVGAHGMLALTEEDLKTYMAGERTKGAYELIVRAPGYAPAIRVVDIPTTQVAVRLDHGQRVELEVTRADGKPAPDTLRPIVYTPDWATPVHIRARRKNGVLHEDTLSISQPEPLGAGRYVVHLPDPAPQFRVLLDEPGFIRAYTAGPFNDALIKREHGHLAFTAPVPGGIAATLRPPDPTTTAPYSQCAIQITRRDANGDWFEFESIESTDPSIDAAIAELPPGKYTVTASTGNDFNRNDTSRANYYYQHRDVEVKAETTSPLDFVYKSRLKIKPPSMDDPSSAARAIVHVTRRNGSPAAGVKYSLVLRGQDTEKVAADGFVPENGAIVFDKLIPADQHWGYSFQIGDDQVGGLWNLKAGSTYETTMSLPLAAGDPAPDVPLYDLESSRSIRLSNLRGKVVVLDFWSVDCGPCRPATTELNSIVRRRLDDWGNRVAAIAVSVDDETTRVKDMIEKNNWSALRHVWSGPSNRGWDAPAPQEFGVQIIPSTFVISPAGIITRADRPSAGAVEEEVDRLLKGEK